MEHLAREVKLINPLLKRLRRIQRRWRRRHTCRRRARHATVVDSFGAFPSDAAYRDTD
jgi:hypothetical protein